MDRGPTLVLVGFVLVGAGFALSLVAAPGGVGPAGDEVGSAANDTVQSPTGNLTVHYLDVGQADATVVEFPNGGTVVIDTGDWRQDGSVVIDYLERLEIARVDHLVATHPHADHIGGHAALVEHYEQNRSGVGAAYDSGVATTTATFERYLDAIEEHDVDLFTVQAGDELAIGNATVEFLNPLAASERDDVHENSVVLTISVGEDRFLFTGDAEADVEERLAANASTNIAADVYQVGHHGSETSSSPPFLDAVDPSVVVISSALDSQYGHPHDETLAAFGELGYETYWTALHGNVTVTSNGSGLAVEAERAAPTNATELAAEKPTEEPAAMVEPGGFGGAAARVIR